MNNAGLVIRVILMFFLPFSMHAQSHIPQDYFSSPIHYELRLAGTFGELRSNHFHMGMDIKSSGGVVGDSIFAVAEGFISRIKVDPGGYGNSLYIEHPAGYTTVYAHLNAYREDIKAYVRALQYSKKSFDIDESPDSLKFRVNKGEFIGFMGTTGYSYGPHLHFEIRDTKSEMPLNPLLFGYTVKDTRSPVMQSVTIYHLNQDLEKLGQEIFYLSPKSGSKVLPDTIEIAAWRIGIGVSSYDPMDNIYNKNGVYKVLLKVDDTLVHRTSMDSISFEETRGLNAHIDYAFYQEYRRKYQRCYALPGIDLHVCETSDGSIIPIYKNKYRKIELLLEDFNGNKKSRVFWVRRKEIDTQGVSRRVFNYILNYNEDNIILRENFKAYFGKGCLYDNLYLHFNVSEETSADQVSALFHIHDDKTPLHKMVDLYIKPNQALDSTLLDKVCLVNCSSLDRYENWGGEFRSEWFHGRINELGTFGLMLDTIAPTIRIKSFNENMQGRKRIQFLISDNLKARGEARDLRSNAYIDGKWVLMEYDLKNKLITHYFDEDLTHGSHDFRLEVTDDRGNTAVFQRKFNY
jgi:murein DD-endopeptidase MepM/ murein hydrolase activator NlpD